MRRFLIAMIAAALPWSLHAQGRGRGQGPGPQATAPSAHGAAPWDITGYWVSLITDDWRYRMLTPPKGNVDYLPITAEGRRLTDTWDPVKDEANGDRCKGYGAGGIMRLPARLHITWDDDNTLRMDIDTGMQTRRFFFDGAPAGASQASRQQPTLQGYSAARWELPGGGRGQPVAAVSTTGSRPGQLRVVTTRLRPGYARKNGVPYGANAVITEHFVRLVDNGGQEYLVVTTTVDDSTHFQPPYIKTYEFKKLADAKGWNPTPCLAR